MNSSSASVLLLSGPNLNMLGLREPDIYGNLTLQDLQNSLSKYAEGLGIRLFCRQSNSESVLIDSIHAAQAYDAIIFNPGAFTHYSYALYDALMCIATPCIEVHLSDITKREAFRAKSVIAPACVAQFYGEGIESYKKALDFIQDSNIINPVGKQLQSASCEEAKDPSRIISSLERDKRDIAELKHVLAKPINPHERIEQVRTHMRNEGIAACFIRSKTDIHWLCAFDYVFDAEPAHALFVSQDSCILHTDSRYSEACKEASLRLGDDACVIVDDTPESHESWFVSCVEARLKNSGEILACERSLTLAEHDRLIASYTDALHKKFSLQAIDSCIPELRSVKDSQEIARMKGAQSITDKAFAHIVQFMHEGLTEREVKLKLEWLLFELGAEALSFDSIVATGANAANPHACSGERVLCQGDAVVMDFGANILGYNSDMTRTVFMGNPTRDVRKAWECLVHAQERACEKIHAGASGEIVARQVEEGLAKAGFAHRMGHGLGHGVGLEIHELPYLSMRRDYVLKDAQVVTVEPGIYIPGAFGMRLEDYGCTTKDGFEIFTESSHECVSL